MKPKTIEEAVAVVPMGTDGPVDSRDTTEMESVFENGLRGKVCRTRWSGRGGKGEGRVRKHGVSGCSSGWISAPFPEMRAVLSLQILRINH
jgi:hypothetical protein